MIKEKKRVVAFRAVEVMDIVRAPKCLVMAAAAEEPKRPVMEKSRIRVTFCDGDQRTVSVNDDDDDNEDAAVIVLLL